ncbi:MAG TPA: T9SS type A sorting domain-containing protein [Chitinophagaceae bacterium]|nr:T9SS type A sorting domain-containing protein [Chitinophagaceae bacterium]
MKRPLRLPAYCLLSLAAIAGIVFFAAGGHESGESEENEKEESIPGVYRSMDLWSRMRTYPLKDMPSAAYYQGYEVAARMSVAARSMNSRELSTTTAPWNPLAPKNFAGRVLCIGFHPTNPNIMWVGSASGGLWKTTTGGTGAPGGINWTFVPTGNFPVLGVHSIAVHPTNPNIIYIGTGEVYNNGAAGQSGPTGGGHYRLFRGSYGVGLLKTEDGGATWQKSIDYSYDNLKGVADILIHPANPDIVFAATTDGVMRTTDGGNTWQNILNVPMANDLCFKPGNASVLYVGAGNFASAGTGIYKTINSIAGSPSFTQLTSGLPSVISGKIQLHISPDNPSMVFASIGRNPETSDAFGLYISSNEGGSWTQRISASTAMGANSALGQGWYAHDVAVSPTNTDSVYWAEMDLYRSSNNGSSFSRVSVWSNWNINFTTVGATNEGNNSNYAHADIHRVYISPFNQNTLFLCTDGGIFRSTNNGTSFQGLNGGLMTAQIYPNMGQSMQDENFMIGGLQDNEGFVYSGSAGCRRIGSLGDGFHAAINPRDDDTCYIASYYLNVKRSVNRAGSFSAVLSNGNPPTEPACFNAPFVIAPSNPNIMYAGTHRIKKSTNRGGAWSNVGPILSHNDAEVLYIAVAPSNADVLYVSVAPGGGQRSKLFRSVNGGANFTEITGTLPDRYYSDIAIDKHNPNRIAVTLSGFGSSHVFLSLNGGTTWTDVSGDLPDIPHNTLMFCPINRRTLYVGNDQGVFYAHGLPTGAGPVSPVTPATWTAYNEGIEPAVLVSDLLVTPGGKLRMATFGRGLWERQLAPASSLPVQFKDFTVRATSTGNQLRWIVSSQSDIDRYEVEYGNDAVNFTKIATVNAIGGAGDISYSHLHAIRNEMDGFYRIRIINTDGTFEYSVVRSVKADKPVLKLSVFPNPTTGMFRIKVPAEATGALNMQLYDAAGKLIMARKLDVQPGMREIPVNITGVAAGNYQLVCEGKQQKWTTRIIKR